MRAFYRLAPESACAAHATGKKNGHISGRKTKDRENPGMKTKTWQNPFK